MDLQSVQYVECDLGNAKQLDSCDGDAMELARACRACLDSNDVCTASPPPEDDRKVRTDGGGNGSSREVGIRS